MNSEQMRDAINGYNSECPIALPKFTLEEISDNYVSNKYPTDDEAQRASWIAYYTAGGGKESIETEMNQLKSNLTKAVHSYLYIVSCISPAIERVEDRYAILGERDELVSKIEDIENAVSLVLQSAISLCYQLPQTVDKLIDKIAKVKKIINGSNVRWCTIAGSGVELMFDKEHNLIHRERPLKTDEHLMLLAYKYNHKSTRGRGKGKYNNHLSRWRKKVVVMPSCIAFDHFVKLGDNKQIDLSKLNWDHYSHATARLKKNKNVYKYVIYALAICRYNGSKETGQWKKQDSFEIISMSKFKIAGINNKIIGIKIMSK